MLLAIDVGNTNTVFALMQGPQIVEQWRIATNGSRTADEYFVWLRQLLAHAEIDVPITDAIIASVAPQTLFNLVRLCERYFSITPMIIGQKGVELGIEVRIDNPNEAGADRLVNAVEAFATYGPDLIIVDFGTATTFDVVASDGAYAGGIIAPGINLSVDALYRAAAKLPRIAVERPERVVGKNTTGAMQSGVYWGYVSLIEGLCARISQEESRSMKIIATGGLAVLFAKGAQCISRVDDDLTLRGLARIFEANRKG